MRIIFLILLTAFLHNSKTLNAQDAYIDCASEICDCLSKIDFSKKDEIYNRYEHCCDSIILDYEQVFVENEKIDFNSSGSIDKMIAKLTNLVIQSCPANYSNIFEVIGNTTRFQTVFGSIQSIEENRFLELEIRNENNELFKMIILHYFPEASEKLEYLLANRNRQFEFEYRKVKVLDLSKAMFIDYLEITKIIIPKE